MCSGDNVYGIVAGLVGAAAILVMAFADKHGGDAHATAPIHAEAGRIQVAPPVSVELGREGVRLDINFGS